MFYQIDEQNKLFVLNAGEMSYAFYANDSGRVCNLHWGGKITMDDLKQELSEEIGKPLTEAKSPCMKQEYAVQEPCYYGTEALRPLFYDGMRGARLHYDRYDGDAEALHVYLRDDYYPLEVELIYKRLGDLSLISRSAVIRCLSDEPIQLEQALSATLHLPDSHYRLTHFGGSWGAEYTKRQHFVEQERIVLDGHRGTRNGHQHTPFMALDPFGKSGETDGEVFFAALQWSGDFEMSVEKDFFGDVCVSAGINGYDFGWELTGDTPFTAPPVVIGYTQHGFGGMSRILYDWQFDILLPRANVYKERPVIYNSWYPYMFSVNEENCIAMAKKAADVGAELFVIDDGWMPGRTTDWAGLGDWQADPKRFPNGLRTVAQACHENGILFGLWVEPEMVNPDSDLYRKHPDWVICDKHRPKNELRHQLILDLSRNEIRDWCINWLCDLIENEKLDYLKWDVNRYATERGEDRTLWVKYIQNIYIIWDTLKKRFPHVLMENCAGGGGRADFGMAAYSDRINRSDNADSVDVMRIHEGFSTLFLPKLAGGAGNITTSPNGVNGRRMDFTFRAASGMLGSMSIGINLLTCTEAEMKKIKDAVSEFKKYRAELQDSYVLRLKSVYEGNISALEYLRRDGSSVHLFVMGNGLRSQEGNLRIRLRDLCGDAIYEDERGVRRSGNAMMNRGIEVQLRGDYTSTVIHIHKVK